MSVLSRLKRAHHHLPRGGAYHHMKHGPLAAFAIDKGTRYGGAFLVGAAKGYYGDRFIWKGHGLDMWGGGAALGLSIASRMFGYHHAAEHLERVADVGVMSALGSLGAHWGLGKAGKVAHTLPAGSIRGTLVGAIAPAVGGKYLSPDDIVNYGRAR